MNCISEENIQKYIDGEVSAKEAEEIKNHISTCRSCAQNLEMQQAFASQMKHAIQGLGKIPEVIPEFKVNKHQPKKRKRTLRKILYFAAAASILALVFLTTQKPRQAETREVILIYNFNDEFDANLPVSKQDFTFSIIDPNGNVSEFHLD